MKIKDGFMLREIAGNWVVVPIGQRVVDFNGLMTLNESGVLLWKKLEHGASREELISSILDEYDVETAIAENDVDEFVNGLKDKEIIV
ncbi:MAG TPA: PqqD family protein [Caldisericia bacterium]|nr:PqqD family protein [Caldisericia bacterium]